MHIAHVIIGFEIKQLHLVFEILFTLLNKSYFNAATFSVSLDRIYMYMYNEVKLNEDLLGK
jgi:hypothetical protein